MKYKKLSEIADVQSGLVLTRKEASSDSKQVIRYKQLNLRSIQEDGTIISDALNDFCAADTLNKQFITQESDIIMRLFAPFHPVLISQPFSGLVVPSQFAIIRITSVQFRAAFLCCYLSQYGVIDEVAIKDGGQSVRGMKISTLSDIKIPILPLDQQDKVIAFMCAHFRKKKLYIDLIEQQDLQAKAVIKRAIGGKV